MELLVFGTKNTTDMAYYYLTHDIAYKNRYKIVGFVEENPVKNKKKYDINVYDFSNIESIFKPEKVLFFAPISAKS